MSAIGFGRPWQLSPGRGMLAARGLFAGRRVRRAPGGWMLGCLLGAACLLVGAAIALQSKLIGVLAVAVLMGPLVLSVRAPTLLGGVYAAAFVVVGILEYFGKFKQAPWLLILLMTTIALRWPADRLTLQPNSQRADGAGTHVWLQMGVFGLLAVFALTTAVNRIPPMQLLVGMRHHLFPLALIALVLVPVITRESLLRCMKALPWVLMLQFPICAYQYFFVARRRSQDLNAVGIAWDAVVGTMGGNPDGGGASGALALFLCLGVAGLIILRRERQITRPVFVAALVGALGSMLLAEVKVVVVFLPLAMLIAQRRKVFSSPGHALIWLLGSAAFGVTIFLVYNAVFWSNRAGVAEFDAAQALSYVFKVEGDARMFNPLTGEVSRLGALLRWFDANFGSHDWLGGLLGHGPASTKFSSLFGAGEIARKYPFRTTTSSMSTMLWELGLLGMGCYVFLLGAAVFALLRRSPRTNDAGQLAIQDIALVTLGLVLAGLAYNADAVNVQAIQVAAMTAIGIAAKTWWPGAKPRPSTASVAPAGSP